MASEHQLEKEEKQRKKLKEPLEVILKPHENIKPWTTQGCHISQQVYRTIGDPPEGTEELFREAQWGCSTCH